MKRNDKLTLAIIVGLLLAAVIYVIVAINILRQSLPEVVIDVADPRTLERVQADMKAGIALGVPGTPSKFLDDGQIKLGTYEDMRKSIVDALESSSR